MRVTANYVLASALFLHDAFGQAVVTPTIVVTTHVSACKPTNSSPSFQPMPESSETSNILLLSSTSGLSGTLISNALSLSSTSSLPGTSTSNVLSLSTAPVLLSTSSSSVSTSPTPSEVPVCGQYYSGSDGPQYQIECGQTYGGEMISSSRPVRYINRRSQLNHKRVIESTFEDCIFSCDDEPSCVAATYLELNCTLLSSITAIVESPAAQAAVRAEYAKSVLPSLANPSTVMSGPTPEGTTATQPYSSALADHISQKMSDDAPVSTSDNTAVYITQDPASSTDTSTTLSYSSIVSDYISDHLSANTPIPTSPDNVVYITDSTSSTSSSGSPGSLESLGTSGPSTTVISATQSSIEYSPSTESSLLQSFGPSVSPSTHSSMSLSAGASSQTAAVSSSLLVASSSSSAAAVSSLPTTAAISSSPSTDLYPVLPSSTSASSSTEATFSSSESFNDAASVYVGRRAAIIPSNTKTSSHKSSSLHKSSTHKTSSTEKSSSAHTSSSAYTSSSAHNSASAHTSSSVLISSSTPVVQVKIVSTKKTTTSKKSTSSKKTTTKKKTTSTKKSSSTKKVSSTKKTTSKKTSTSTKKTTSSKKTTTSKSSSVSTAKKITSTSKKTSTTSKKTSTTSSKKTTSTPELYISDITKKSSTSTKHTTSTSPLKSTSTSTSSSKITSTSSSLQKSTSTSRTSTLTSSKVTSTSSSKTTSKSSKTSTSTSHKSTTTSKTSSTVIAIPALSLSLVLTGISSTNTHTSSSSSSKSTTISGTPRTITTSSTSSVTPTSTSPTYACPANDGQHVVDNNGVNYTLGCGNDTYGGGVNGGSAQNNFNDCFAFCDAVSDCVGFTYLGGVNGTGAGTCYLKEGYALSGMYFTPGNSQLVGAIRYVPVVSSSSSSSSTSNTILSSTVSSTGTSTATTSSPKATTTTRTSTSTTGSATTSTSSSRSSTSSTSKTTSSSHSTTLTSTALTTSSKSSSSSSSTTTTSSTTSSASSTPTYVQNTGKRGLSYNQANLTLPYAISGQNSQVSWAYDWYYQPCSSGASDCQFNPALEFVPLLYNNDRNLLAAWPTAAQLAINNGSTALMSFNEPDYCIDGSACMSINASVSTYQKYMQPFAGKALLGAPAVTNAGSDDQNPMGLKWLQYFIGNCTGCTIDFINLHWYSNKYAGASYFESHVNSARAIADGRPIWITEFGLDSSYSYTDAELQAFLQQVMPWLDQQSDVHRYAYFMDAPGILINNAGTGLSGTGVVYNNFTNSTYQSNAYT